MSYRNFNQSLNLGFPAYYPQQRRGAFQPTSISPYDVDPYTAQLMQMQDQPFYGGGLGLTPGLGVGIGGGQMFQEPAFYGRGGGGRGVAGDAMMNDVLGMMQQLDPYSSSLGSSFGRRDPFGGGSAMTLIDNSPYVQKTQNMMNGILEQQRLLASDRLTDLVENALELPEGGGGITFTHQTYERCSARGDDGRWYEREEKCLTDSDGAKKHVIKSVIDDDTKVSTWTVKAGQKDSECPHLITYTNPSKKNHQEFEKKWHKSCPFLGKECENDKACLEAGEEEEEKVKRTSLPFSAAKKIEGKKK